MEWSERHTLIMEQAAALFATKGIAGTKVRDIADGVGILSGSLYHYFPSKDAIAELIVTQYLDASSTSTRRSSRRRTDHENASTTSSRRRSGSARRIRTRPRSTRTTAPICAS